MPPRTTRLSDKAALPFKTSNKQRRQDLHIKQKRARDALKRAERFSRKKEEAKNPRLREERLRRNVPITLDKKRVYDEIAYEPEDGGLGMVYDVERLKRRKLAEEQELQQGVDEADDMAGKEGDDEDHDSMLEDSDGDESHPDEVDLERADLDENTQGPLPSKSQLNYSRTRLKDRASSPTRSTASTNLSLAPAALAAKFPTLFLSPDSPPPPPPKILITTSINSTLHDEAATLTSLFPCSKYIRRSSHRYGYKFSVREISAFAAKNGYTSVIVLEENQKRPSGMTVVHLPVGPTFHFTISNWYSGKQIPGHGQPTNHVPELILNNFTTPLGLVTAQLFRSLFPATPELQGRQVLTLHNQRDYIFLRRHRYMFRAKRETERSVVGADGKEMKGTEGIRAGLQELGPRMTLKLRRVDKGIQRASGQEWEWKAKMEKTRTKFQL
ncbi:uncharacterized protein Z519_00092 [Cladophialophora bantiana CBS 173.52]|uniref:Brix domain-containing protein n=1 Tax=Cladophialophora bantiana (strain ATCC 10958 / CBS 173.52 / CDC B-1940 / NIH 8579) TaxID=1442370 RepID=A0A0D2GJ72_CLAB1|nr:uncharacterized protein Z519_00092 [Cladophialophora bantiana CBS 173.52]KIW98432.1 hypothetical protein Z519_00092 [Cladophialophora bantiana CBS 173.52]